MNRLFLWGLGMVALLSACNESSTSADDSKKTEPIQNVNVAFSGSGSHIHMPGLSKCSSTTDGSSKSVDWYASGYFNLYTGTGTFHFTVESNNYGIVEKFYTCSGISTFFDNRGNLFTNEKEDNSVKMSCGDVTVDIYNYKDSNNDFTVENYSESQCLYIN
jgi:hypothetical protein